MKQIEYNETQKVVIDVIQRLKTYLGPRAVDVIEKIKKDYDIKDQYLTIRNYINRFSSGSYHTFYFTLDGVEIAIRDIYGMLCDEYCALYPLTAKYYVVGDEEKNYGGNCENYHCDHYLKLEEKED